MSAPASADPRDFADELVARARRAGATAAQARLAMMELGAEVALDRRPGNEDLGRQFVRTAKRQWFSRCMSDVTGRSLSYGSALTASLLLSRLIRERTEGQTHVGLLVPASIGGALANVATTFAGKTAVNLNFTAGAESMAHAVERCGIRTILTSRVFLAKAIAQGPRLKYAFTEICEGTIPDGMPVAPAGLRPVPPERERDERDHGHQGRDGEPSPATPTVHVTLTGGQGTINVNSWAPDSKRFAYVSYVEHRPPSP